jgi:uncharacterized membrane protein (GlpM family)
MELVERFLLGGFIVSAFAVVAEAVRPKSFAGLFGAAPSVALATLTLTLFTEGKHYAALEARSMIAGAFAFLGYTLACVYFMGKRHLRAAPTTVVLLAVWGILALGFWSLFLR